LARRRGATDEPIERVGHHPGRHSCRARRSVPPPNTDNTERSGDGRLQFHDVYLQNESGEPVVFPIAGLLVEVVLEFERYQDLPRIRSVLTIYNQLMVAVTHCSADAIGQQFNVPKGRGRVIFHIPKLPLLCGKYKIAVSAYDGRGDLDWVPTACVFSVEAGKFFPAPFMPPIQYSTALVDHSWRLVANTDHHDHDRSPGGAL